jgi:hypothetical protein
MYTPTGSNSGVTIDRPRFIALVIVTW